MFEIWNAYLYNPVLNTLMVLYNTLGLQNLGLAVVWLTILTRVVLIPFSFIAERNFSRYAAVGKKWEELARDVPNDMVLRRDMMRAFIKEQQVSPWARILLLGVQLLVLVLLYQAFTGGFADPEHMPLYSFVDRPEVIETSFFGIFDVAKRLNYALSGIVAVLLFISIAREQRALGGPVTRSQLWFRLFFPLSMFVGLLFLPAVKGVFILTSMGFTVAFHLLKVKVDAWAEKKAHAPVATTPSPPTLPMDGSPWDALRK